MIDVNVISVYFQNGIIRNISQLIFHPSKKQDTISLIEQFQYRHTGNGRDLCGTKDTSTRITDIVVNEVITESIVEVDHLPVRRVHSRCFWLNARYRETDPAIYLKCSRTDGNDIGNSE